MRERSVFLCATVALGAALPDIDGLSLFFSHPTYYGADWFSHRGATHSLVGVIAVSAIAASGIVRSTSAPDPNRRLLAIWAGLCAGGFLHLLEDLPSPPGPWGGLPLAWPFADTRFGGTSQIWWLNEYLMVICFAGGTTSLAIEASARRMALSWSTGRRLLLACAHAWSLALAARFVLLSKFVDATQWAEHQRHLLGGDLYSAVQSLNSALAHLWRRELF